MKNLSIHDPYYFAWFIYSVDNVTTVRTTHGCVEKPTTKKEFEAIDKHVRESDIFDDLNQLKR